MNLKKMLLLVGVGFFLSTSDMLSVTEGAQGSANPDNLAKTGAAGGQFLKIGVGARGTAMGAYAAMADDLTAVYWNPAGVSKIGGVEANFNYTQWFGNFSHNFGAVGFPVGENFRMAVSFTSLTSGEIERTTISQPNGTGTFYSVSDMAIGLTFAGRLTEQFNFGITARSVRNAFANVAATGFAFDIGTTYDTGLEGIVLAFSLHNLGTEMAYTGQDMNVIYQGTPGLPRAPQDAMLMGYDYNLPLAFRAGMKSEVWNIEDQRLTMAFDFLTQSDSREQVALGGEYLWKDILAIRAGYIYGHDNLGFVGGIGVNYISGDFNGGLDFSINPTANIGIINRLSLVLGF